MWWWREAVFMTTQCNAVSVWLFGVAAIDILSVSDRTGCLHSTMRRTGKLLI
jgi:hypothetical protein